MTLTIKPACINIEEGYNLDPLHHILYTNSNGKEEVRLSICINFGSPEILRYSDGELKQRENPAKNRVGISSDLESLIKKLPLHVRKVMGVAPYK